jgi:hypothetical protein
MVRGTSIYIRRNAALISLVCVSILPGACASNSGRTGESATGKLGAAQEIPTQQPTVDRAPNGQVLSQKRENPQQLRLPTATEVFNLRAKCVDLSHKFDNYFPRTYQGLDALGSPWGFVMAAPHYDPRSNRCYVLVRGDDYDGNHMQQLVDGQTGEELAEFTLTHGQKDEPGGRILVGNWREWVVSLGIPPNSVPNSPYEDREKFAFFVRSVINKAMEQ